MLLNAPRARALMAEAGVDGLLATTPPNVLYLTGVSRPREVLAVAALDRLDRPGLVIGVGVVDFARGAFEGVRAFTHGTFYRERGDRTRWTEQERLLAERFLARDPLPSGIDALVAALEDAGLAHAAVAHDERGLDPREAEELTRRLPGLRLVPGFALFRRLRSVKAAEEIRRMRDAVRITEEAMVISAEAARAGMEQREISFIFESEQLRRGAGPNVGHISFGRNGSLGDSNVPTDTLQRGDTIRYDVGCVYRGYASDISRTFAFGPVDPRAERYYAALRAGEEAAMAAVRPGVRADELFEIAVTTVREAGIPHYRRHHVGHGYGIGGAGYDLPLIAPGDATPLEPGMVLMIETPYYELGLGGLQVEDALVVTASGHELLTTLDRGMRQLLPNG